jgi:hypothetical protein
MIDIYCEWCGRSSLSLEQANHTACLEIHIYIVESRTRRETWYSHDITADRVNVPCPDSSSDIAHLTKEEIYVTAVSKINTTPGNLIIYNISVIIMMQLLPVIVNPVGTPFAAASVLREYCVLAMQIGR